MTGLNHTAKIQSCVHNSDVEQSSVWGGLSNFLEWRVINHACKEESWGMGAAITYICISQLQNQLLRLHLHVHSDRQASWTNEDKK